MPATNDLTAAPVGAEYDPARHYDRITEAWGLLLGEELHYGVFATGDEALPAATQALTDAMVDAAHIEPGVAVLDVGCGTGGPARHLGGLGADVTGITTSAVGVAEATARTAAAGLGARVRFEVRDGMANGFPDASFDRAWVLESSHLMADRVALLAECARVLRPGGRIALCDVIVIEKLPLTEVKRLLQPFVLLRTVFGAARMEPLHQYAAWLTELGLEVDTTTDLTEATRPTFDRWRTNAEVHHDAAVAAMGAQALDDFVAACDVLDAFWADGTLGYGLVAARKP